MTKTAIISVDYMHSWAGTAIPTDYKFVCYICDKEEAKMCNKALDAGLDLIQVEMP
jgi:hypothetical protein